MFAAMYTGLIYVPFTILRSLGHVYVLILGFNAMSEQSPSNGQVLNTGTADDLVFQDVFTNSNLNSTYWNTFMTSNSTLGGPWDSNGQGGSGVGGPLDADYDEPYEISVANGLTLNAVKQPVVGDNYIDGALQSQEFPITASVIDTYGKVEFDGGFLQISMKESTGDGAWPSLWLLPGSGAGNVGNNFEIDIQEGGYADGATNPNDVMAYHLHTPAGVFGGVINTGVDLTATFNTFGVNLIPGKSITWYLNGAAVASITSATAPIPDELMELIMSNQVATSATSAWRTALDASTPASMPMQVSDVRLSQTPDSGEVVIGANVDPTPLSQLITSGNRIVTVSNSSISVASNLQCVTVAGSNNNVVLSTNDQFGVTGSSTTVIGSGNQLFFNSGDTNDTAAGNYNFVSIASGDQIGFTGTGDAVFASSAMLFENAGSASDTVIGSNDAINLANNVTVGVTGAGNVVYGSASTVFINSGGRDDAVIGNGDTDNFASGVSFGVAGTNNAEIGSSGTLYINPGVSADTVFGSNNLVNVSSSDVVGFSGANNTFSGSSANLFLNTGSTNGQVNGSNDSINLGGGVSATVTGNSNTISVFGFGDSVSLFGNQELLVYQTNFGRQSVTGFSSPDVISLSSSEFSSASAAFGAAQQQGGNVVISGPNSEQLTLIGVTLSSLSASQFAVH